MKNKGKAIKSKVEKNKLLVVPILFTTFSPYNVDFGGVTGS
jgi:hypothetical protein